MTNKPTKTIDIINAVKPSLAGFVMQNYGGIVLSLLILSLLFYTISSALFINEMKALSHILTMLAIAVLLVVLVYGFLYKEATTIYVDEEKVSYETGVLERVRKDIPIAKITDSVIQRSVLERVLGLATLYINTAGRAEYEIVQKYLPYHFAKRIRDNIYKHMEKLGKSSMIHE